MKTDEEEVAPAPRKRAPRKRVVATDAEGEATPRPRTRRAPKKEVALAEEEEEVHELKRHHHEEEEEELVRRAPTPLKAEKRVVRNNRRNLILGVAGLVVGVGASVGIGYTDKGQIDVVAVVTARNEKINRGEVRDAGGNVITSTLPVQNTDPRPNGGLVPAEVQPTASTTPEVAPVTIAAPEATTTPETAASTTEATPQTEAPKTETASTSEAASS